jgi:hypothetical protein
VGALSVDGFFTLEAGRGSRSACPFISFGVVQAVLPARDRWREIGRADWQWDGGSTARLRIHGEGRMVVGSITHNRLRVTATPLYRALGRPLRGVVPIRIDGDDLYIDVSGVEAGQ